MFFVILTAIWYIWKCWHLFKNTTSNVSDVLVKYLLYVLLFKDTWPKEDQN